MGFGGGLELTALDGVGRLTEGRHLDDTATVLGSVGTGSEVGHETRCQCRRRLGA